MPYRSERQRRFMHARHPGVARRWDAELSGVPAAEVAKALSDDAESYLRRRREQRKGQGNVMGAAGAVSGALVASRAAQLTSAPAWRAAGVGGLSGFAAVRGLSELAAVAEQRKLRRAFEDVESRPALPSRYT